MEIFKNKKFLKVFCIVLSVVLCMSLVSTIGHAITKGERTNCKKAVEEYNSSVPDSSHLYTVKNKELVAAMLNETEENLKTVMASVDIDSLIFNDDTVTAVGKLLGQYTSTEFSAVDFSSMEKKYPQAYSYLAAEQQAGKTWADLNTVPFGVTVGDREAFVKACGAMGDFMGGMMISLMLDAPSIYNDALVPVLESLHTGKMPSLSAFALKTGLSNKARIEFLVERVISIIDPIKEAPLTYLLDILPDFIVNYNRAYEFISSKELSLTLPSIDSILTSLLNTLEMTNEPLDLDYVSSLGVASVDKSGGNGGKRVKISGDRETLFLFLADYITGLFSYGNNFPAVENILSFKIKELDSSSKAGQILSSSETKVFIASLMNVIASTTAKHNNVSATTAVEQHNSTPVDDSEVFGGILTRENTASIIDKLDSYIVSYLNDNNISVDSVIYTDYVATAVTRLTAILTGKELSEISFAALKTSYPEAYEYVTALKNEGKTWNDVGTIPFGITQGDRDSFVKACGAGAEHFGDTLALCLMVSPTAYEEALIPLLEALHTGPMPDLKAFVSAQGLDGAKRMQDLTEKVLTIIEPVKQAPISYLCQILPDLINSYNSASNLSAKEPDMSLTGLILPELNTFLSNILGGFGITVPEYDFNEIVKLSTASVVQSGDRTGQRVELNGDREAVFIRFASYIISLANHEKNMSSITAFATRLLGIDTQFISDIINALETVTKGTKNNTAI